MDKLDQLKTSLKQMESVLVAFSGGVDSTFLSKVAYDVLGENAIAVSAISSTCPQREKREAIELAKQIGIKHEFIKSEETDIEGFRSNQRNRCYLCKKELYTKLLNYANKKSINFVLDGSNADDINDFRPGMMALKELRIRSPLMEAGLTKQEIREMSKELGLTTWSKPSFACLSSRFPYGTQITPERLEQVEKAEDLINDLGARQFRVRYHNDLARIEVNETDFGIIIKNKDRIVKAFRKLGFKYTSLDLKGYRTGSMNEGSIRGI